MNHVKGLDEAVLGHWIDKLELALFPHQESEFEQEAFTSQGRKRAGAVLQELVKAVRQNDRRQP